MRLIVKRPFGSRTSISFLAAGIVLAFSALTGAQSPSPGKVELGSQTARNGFKNEDEIAAKFNNWKVDDDARLWLSFMGYKSPAIESVVAAKPHGEKADIQVRIKATSGEKVEGISIKLVSTATGFNQIDKRWLRQYVKMWKMPADVEAAMRLYLGEVKPSKPTRTAGRMYLNEFDAETQKKIVDFFTTSKALIVSDLFKGDGVFSAGWMMVALKSTAKPRWVLRSIDYVIRFYSEGPVEITRQGNLKIGRVTVQRKGGDGGRETANMLQFKINPTLIFN